MDQFIKSSIGQCIFRTLCCFYPTSLLSRSPSSGCPNLHPVLCTYYNRRRGRTSGRRAGGPKTYFSIWHLRGRSVDVDQFNAFNCLSIPLWVVMRPLRGLITTQKSYLSPTQIPRIIEIFNAWHYFIRAAIWKNITLLILLGNETGPPLWKYL